MGEKRGAYLALFLAVLCITLISANFQTGVPSYSIAKEYSGGGGIVGWINISFENESNSSLFNDSFGNSMTLQGLLNKNSNFIYNLTSDGNVTNLSYQKLYLDNENFFTPKTAGNYTYKLNLSTKEIFSENITIIAGVTGVNATLQEKIDKLNSIKATIAGFDSFIQKALNETLKINETETKLNGLKKAYENSSATDAQILANLSNITIPNSVYKSESSDRLTFFSNKSDINLGVLESIGAGTYEAGQEDDYINAILFWNQENIETKINFTELSAVYNTSNKVLVKIFDVNITKKKALDYAPFFIIKKLDKLTFKENYGEKESGIYFYISIPESKKTISFLTTEDIEFSNLPAFTVPPLNKLNFSEGGYEPFSDQTKKSKWIIFLLIIVLLIIIGIITYVSLHAWYKKRYEKYLFKDKNDLYNLATYITTSKAKGLNNDQINENLKKARWNSEQIRYAMRKYAGKNTGMLEIPLKKALDKKEKMQ